MAAFLAARGIHLPWELRTPVPLGDRRGTGSPQERIPGAHRRRRRARLRLQRAARARPHRVRDRVAVITASRNADAVRRRRAYRAVSGPDRRGHRSRAGTPGKPDPAIFIEAARRLGTSPPHPAVIEDSIAGLRAGRRGSFRLVIGVDRTGHPAAVARRGADVARHRPPTLSSSLQLRRAEPSASRRSRPRPAQHGAHDRCRRQRGTLGAPVTVKELSSSRKRSTRSAGLRANW